MRKGDDRVSVSEVVCTEACGRAGPAQTTTDTEVLEIACMCIVRTGAHADGRLRTFRADDFEKSPQPSHGVSVGRRVLVPGSSPLGGAFPCPVGQSFTNVLLPAKYDVLDHVGIAEGTFQGPVGAPPVHIKPKSTVFQRS